MVFSIANTHISVFCGAMRSGDSLRLFAAIFLGLVCFVGDRLVEYQSDSALGKAICDSLTHAAVGLLSATILVLQLMQHIPIRDKLLLILICCLLSSLIDVDHFIAARSLRLAVRANLMQQSRKAVNCSFLH